jgi:ferredoxin
MVILDYRRVGECYSPQGEPVKVRVDPDLCQGHAVCFMTSPDLFHLRDDDGHAYVDSEDVPPEMEDAAQLGADSCPERAISVF